MGSAFYRSACRLLQQEEATLKASSIQSLPMSCQAAWAHTVLSPGTAGLLEQTPEAALSDERPSLGCQGSAGVS